MRYEDETNYLRRYYGWPSTKPENTVPVQGFLCDEVKQALLDNGLQQAVLVVEVGAFHGASTRWMCDNSHAHIITIDHFQGSPHLKGNVNTDLMWETFVAACWDNYRGRITPLPVKSREGLLLCEWMMFECPDLVYLDGSHTYEDTRLELELCLTAWPRAAIVGDDYSTHLGVRQALDAMKGWRNFNFDTNGRAWWRVF